MGITWRHVDQSKNEITAGRGNHNISAIVHKSHYNWCSDAVCSWKLNDLPGVISLSPRIFFIASFVEMQPYWNLNTIKAVIFQHVVEFELLIRHQLSPHTHFLSYLRQPVHLYSLIIWQLENHLHNLLVSVWLSHQTQLNLTNWTGFTPSDCFFFLVKNGTC